MERMIVIFILITLIGSPTLVFSQANPRGKTVSGEVEIEYGRPSAKGRNIMELISPGTYWRMGADDATILTTKTQLVFGDVVVAEGVYSLLAHFTEEGHWEVIICKEVARGFRPKGIIAVAPLGMVEDQPHVEKLTIDLKGQENGYQFILSWGSNRLQSTFLSSK